MSHSPPDDRPHPYPRHVAVVGAAGGLGQGILTVCRDEGVGFTAIVRSRPERITNVPSGSRVAVVPSLADRSALSAAFAGADAVLTALGVTATVASADWAGTSNSWMPVSYRAMGRWMLQEAAADEFVRAAPLVSRRR